jgi:predicted aldo/keto reductase-like oxidoreductase
MFDSSEGLYVVGFFSKLLLDKSKNVYKFGSKIPSTRNPSTTLGMTNISLHNEKVNMFDLYRFHTVEEMKSL